MRRTRPAGVEMEPERLFTHLLAELRHRSAVDVDPAAYWRGVTDALTAMRGVAALSDPTVAAELIAASDLTDVPDPTASAPLRDEARGGPSDAQLEQAASWLAGFVVAATHSRSPEEEAVEEETVEEAVRLVGGSSRVLERANGMLLAVESLQEGHRGRALRLLASCRERLRGA